jgi:putative addiction module killer protein
MPIVEVLQTADFRQWMERLKDSVARNRIVARIDRAASGNLGDWKSVGGGVAEMRIDHGPGYRVYFVRHGDRMIVILAGGTKRTQSADIRKAIEIATELEK